MDDAMTMDVKNVDVMRMRRRVRRIMNSIGNMRRRRSKSAAWQMKVKMTRCTHSA